MHQNSAASRAWQPVTREEAVPVVDLHPCRGERRNAKVDEFTEPPVALHLGRVAPCGEELRDPHRAGGRTVSSVARGLLGDRLEHARQVGPTSQLRRPTVQIGRVGPTQRVRPVQLVVDEPGPMKPLEPNGQGERSPVRHGSRLAGRVSLPGYGYRVAMWACSRRAMQAPTPSSSRTTPRRCSAAGPRAIERRRASASLRGVRRSKGSGATPR